MRFAGAVSQMKSSQINKCLKANEI